VSTTKAKRPVEPFQLLRVRHIVAVGVNDPHKANRVLVGDTAKPLHSHSPIALPPVVFEGCDSVNAAFHRAGFSKLENHPVFPHSHILPTSFNMGGLVGDVVPEVFKMIHIVFAVIVTA